MDTEKPTLAQRKASNALRDLAEYAMYISFKLDVGETPFGKGTVDELIERYDTAIGKWRYAIGVR